MNKSILISSIAAMVGTGAVVANPAQAAFFTSGSTFGIAGTVDANPLGEFLDGQPIVGYDFNPLNSGTPTDGAGEGDFNILQSNSGTFAQFNPLPTYYGQITDLPNPMALPVGEFLQFASADSVDPSDFDIFFDLQEITAIQYNFTGTGLTNSVGVVGVFTSTKPEAAGETAIADGTFSADLTFDTISAEINQQLGLTGANAIEVDQDIATAILTGDVDTFNTLAGTSITQAQLDALIIEDVRYSADFVIGPVEGPGEGPVVPEASNVAGLVGIGLAGALALRKRKQVNLDY